VQLNLPWPLWINGAVTLAILLFLWPVWRTIRTETRYIAQRATLLEATLEGLGYRQDIAADRTEFSQLLKSIDRGVWLPLFWKLRSVHRCVAGVQDSVALVFACGDQLNGEIGCAFLTVLDGEDDRMAFARVTPMGTDEDPQARLRFRGLDKKLLRLAIDRTSGSLALSARRLEIGVIDGWLGVCFVVAGSSSTWANELAAAGELSRLLAMNFEILCERERLSNGQKPG
jgi:hypothetical protein